MCMRSNSLSAHSFWDLALSVRVCVSVCLCFCLLVLLLPGLTVVLSEASMHYVD